MKIIFETEVTSIPKLEVGDIIQAMGFIAEVVSKRDIPARVEGVTEGADGPCSQVDLKLVPTKDKAGESTFNFLVEDNGLAMLQGNHLYKITRLHEVEEK